MKIRKLSIINFRNYEKLLLEFNDNINIFIGDNGEGKTNILESIYVLAITKSHRSNIDKNLIKNGMEYLKITGEISSENKINTHEILINNKGKRVSINRNAFKKISDYISSFTVILFSPDDLELIKGSPSERRKFLNIEIGELDNKYVYYQNEYNNLVKNRNEYLKHIDIDKYNKEYLDIINNQIVEKSLKIYKYRFSFIKEMTKNLKRIYLDIFNLNINIKYINTCDLDEYDETKISNILLNKLTNNLKKEIILGSTQYGPHKDDFEIYLEDKNIKEYGSQGEQRLAILCIKLSELNIFKDIKNEYPVLLLDDVFSELDIEKRNKLIEIIDPNIQVFITSTDIKNISKKLLINATIYKIKNNKVS